VDAASKALLDSDALEKFAKSPLLPLRKRREEVFLVFA
jgi:hypothetical protein